MERYLALDRHFARTKSPHMGFSTRRTFLYIAAILAFTVAFNMPPIFEHEVWIFKIIIVKQLHKA